MKEKIFKILKKPTELSEKEISNLIEIPKDSKLGDYAFPCFILAKKFKKNPVEIAAEISKNLKISKEFEKIESVGPYINFFVNKVYLAEEVFWVVFWKRFSWVRIERLVQGHLIHPVQLQIRSRLKLLPQPQHPVYRNQIIIWKFVIAYDC